jgi:hypothetical protein
MLYLYRLIVLILPLLFLTPLKGVPLAWCLLGLFPSVVIGSLIGAALKKERVDRREAESEDREFEFTDLVNPSFKRMVAELFGLYISMAVVVMFAPLSSYERDGIICLLFLLAAFFLISLTAAAYSALIVGLHTSSDNPRRSGMLGGLISGIVLEASIFAAIAGHGELNFILLLLFQCIFLIALRLVAKPPRPERVGKSIWLTGALMGVLLLGLGYSVYISLTYRHHRGGQLTACKSNLKNMGTAMEMYSTDYSGKYPTDISLLTPNYLKTIPNCPQAGRVTYTLQTGPDAGYNTPGFKDYYFFQCEGDNHKSYDVPPNYPQYDGIRGLIVR